MKRLLIVCEGPTEQDFCNTLLCEHLAKYDVNVSAPLIKKSNGGIVSWESIRSQIINHLCEKNAIVTMFIDYYGIQERHKFPGWGESKGISDKANRIHFLIDKMREDVPDNLRYRFIPYLQLHEFESLLFSDGVAYKEIFAPEEADIDEIELVIEQFSTPEDINDSPDTAPSKRLIKAIPTYNKIVYGNIIAEQIGLQAIRQKCPLFNEWLILLENL